MTDPADPPIRRATTEDAGWVRRLLKDAHAEGTSAGTLAWWRYANRTRFHARGIAERWLCIGTSAFVHYRVREDMTRVVEELVVDRDARRRGLASRLVAAVGRPIEVRVPAGRPVVALFLLSRGLHAVAAVSARPGGRRLVIYRAD